MRRTQIYLDERQSARLAACASRLGRTRSDLIREAVESFLDEAEGAHDERLAGFRAALDGTFGAAPHLPSGEAFVDEVRRGDHERDEALERRWLGR